MCIKNVYIGFKKGAVMPFISTREKIELSKEEKTKLATISKSRTESKSKIERATMLILYSEVIQYLLSPESFIQIARE